MLIRIATSLILISTFSRPLNLDAADALNAAVLQEVFFTSRHYEENVDSPTVWINGDFLWLISTCKGTHNLRIESAVNGAMIKYFGGLGNQQGQFNRPNGIAAIDDILLVVERDNQRVQVLSLPGLVTLTCFGEGELIKPYGLWVHKQGNGEYTVYVSDAYEGPGESPLPDSQLNRRIKVYDLKVEGTEPQTAEGELNFVFGSTSGIGRLHLVESIYGDPDNNRLMIAEEETATGEQCVKVYDLAGHFSGRVLGLGLFRGQPEGIALYASDQSSGLWIFTDQGKKENFFHVFDRESLEYVGSFHAPTTLNTDGVWLHAGPITERYPKGLFFALHNDGNVAAFDWQEVLTALSRD